MDNRTLYALDLRRLGYLVAIIEHQSFSNAAVRLGVSQPALTKAIQQLEEELEVRLLHRSRKWVVATSYGSVLYRHAKSITAVLADASTEIRMLKGEIIDGVRFGGLPSLVGGLIASAISRMSEDFPGLTIRIIEAHNAELLRGLRDGEIDFAVIMSDENVDLSGLRQRLILKERMALVVRNAHPVLGRQSLQLGDLCSFPWVYPMIDAGHRLLLERIFAESAVRLPAARFECNSVQFARSLIPSTDFIGILPTHAITWELDNGILARLPIRTDTFTRAIAIVTRQSQRLTDGCRAVIRAIEAQCHALG